MIQSNTPTPQNNQPKHKKKFPLLLLLLAILCIFSAELVACRFFEPIWYDHITAPVKATVHTVSSAAHALGESIVEGGKQVVSFVAQQWNSFTTFLTEQDEPEEIQSAGAPAKKNPAPILDPAITELLFENDVEILTGGIVPIVYFNQGDAHWSEQPYGSDDIGRYGCGPAVMAMAIYSLTGKETDPAQIAQAAVSGGHWAKKSGSYLSIVPCLAEEFNLNSEIISKKTPESLEETLLSGKLLVALMGPGHFTKGGHFILIRGITLNGTLLVADPNSRDRSLQEWDAQLLLDELSSSTAHGAPLWSLEYLPS